VSEALQPSFRTVRDCHKPPIICNFSRNFPLFSGWCALLSLQKVVDLTVATMDLKAVLQGIKPDLVAVKERWSDEIKVCTHPNPQPSRRDPLTLRMGQHVRNASSIHHPWINSQLWICMDGCICWSDGCVRGVRMRWESTPLQVLGCALHSLTPP
jgi:hypothetical protein